MNSAADKQHWPILLGLAIAAAVILHELTEAIFQLEQMLYLIVIWILCLVGAVAGGVVLILLALKLLYGHRAMVLAFRFLKSLAEKMLQTDD